MVEIIKIHDSLYKKFPVATAIARSLLIGVLAGGIVKYESSLCNSTLIALLSTGFNIYLNRKIYLANMDSMRVYKSSFNSTIISAILPITSFVAVNLI